MERICLTPESLQKLFHSIINLFHFEIEPQLIKEALSGNMEIPMLSVKSNPQTISEAITQWETSDAGSPAEFSALRKWIYLTTTEKEIAEAFSSAYTSDDEKNTHQKLAIRKWAEILFFSNRPAN